DARAAPDPTRPAVHPLRRHAPLEGGDHRGLHPDLPGARHHPLVPEARPALHHRVVVGRGGTHTGRGGCGGGRAHRRAHGRGRSGRRGGVGRVPLPPGPLLAARPVRVVVPAVVAARRAGVTGRPVSAVRSRRVTTGARRRTGATPL